MKMKKTLTALLACSLAAGCLTACGGADVPGVESSISKEAQKAAAEGKTVISIPMYPSKDSNSYEKMEAARKEFMELNPDIYVEGNQYAYGFNTFTAMATGNELPTMFNTYYTQVDSIIKNGYAADITEALDRAGYTEYLNEDLLEYTSDENGKIYALTWSAYNQGLYINKTLFREAGLVDDNGDILVPDTYDDILEYSKIIREKTGKAGFAFPNADNCGGWNFVNVAWSYGVNFVERDSDGKYKAVFDTQEMRDALNWMSEMKKADAFPTNVSTIGQDKMKEIFGTNQAAMMFSGPPNSALSSSYGMDPKEILVVRMPEGPEGRYSQLGGDVYMFRADASAEQIDACLKWLAYRGTTPILSEESEKQMRQDDETTLENNGIVLSQESFTIWTNPERTAKIKEIKAETTNVDPKDYESYFAGEGVILRPEPEVVCQELYSILDGVLQSINADPDADLDALIKDAANQWQTNYLDNL